MAEATIGFNSIPCGGIDNEKNGCQEIFPRNTSDICQKCKKLNATGISEADINNIENASVSPFFCLSFIHCFIALKFIVCSQCGICGRNIANPCGTCRRKGKPIC